MQQHVDPKSLTLFQQMARVVRGVPLDTHELDLPEGLGHEVVPQSEPLALLRLRAGTRTETGCYVFSLAEGGLEVQRCLQEGVLLPTDTPILADYHSGREWYQEDGQWTPITNGEQADA